MADESDAAPGRVFTDLSADEWMTLDAFEDPTYALIPVALSNGRHGLAYVWPEAALSDTWTFESIGTDGMAAYLDRVRAWRNHYESATG